MWCGHRKKDRQRNALAQWRTVLRQWFRSVRERRKADTYTAVVIALYWTVKLAWVIPWQLLAPWHR
ncbi:hypothetical protein ACICHK_41040 [Streptomyces sp. AHU1]|uniref:hypothetical protein n=1 Tax=Streptomyces sp. AHU1 TaxID=3377215 RepID=UPI0038782975